MKVGDILVAFGMTHRTREPKLYVMFTDSCPDTGFWLTAVHG